MYTKSILHYPT